MGVGTVLMLALSALGLGQIFGAIGNLVGQLNLVAGGSLNIPGVNVDPQQLVNALRTGARVGFFSLLISAVAAVLGGWLGGRTDDSIGHMVKDLGPTGVPRDQFRAAGARRYPTDLPLRGYPQKPSTPGKPLVRANGPAARGSQRRKVLKARIALLSVVTLAHEGLLCSLFAS